MAYCLLSVKAEQSFAGLQATAYPQQAALFLNAPSRESASVLYATLVYNHSSWKFHDAQ